MNLHLCPPEIQSYIFELACLDDGNTARSLCLVSHYFYSTAERYLLQSLAISGPQMIITLAAKLENTPFYKRPIRHLFISDRRMSQNDKRPSRNSAPPLSGTKEALEPLNSLTRIIILAAPTLESLTLVCATPHIGTSAISRVFRTEFPRLRDLTVSGFYSFPTTPRKFPALRRLHLHGNRNPHGLLQVGGLEEACPVLEELHVSGLSMAVSFVLEITEALLAASRKECRINEDRLATRTVPLAPAPAWMLPSRLPATVKKLSVQLGPDMATKSSIHASKEGLMMDALDAISSPNGFYFSIRPRVESVQALVEGFRREWAERLA